ncbi:MAG: tetraacyldisaccharide 4'-kinase [Desulfobulbaceae bacterium]
MNRPLLYTLGRPLSPLYGLLMVLRASLYRIGLLPSARMTVPVVSIGNLTMGGTGKTPLVQYVARLLQRQGRHPAIISRGYGGTARDRCNIVSAGDLPMLEAAVAGDEPRLLAETLPGVPVLTGRSRKFPARRAVELGADVLILDDGFQHLALQRDINLVLFHADTLAGNSRVFPGGDLREPVDALKRADAFILTGVCERNRERADRFAALLAMRFPGRPIFRAGYEPTSVLVYENHTSSVRALTEIRTMPLFAFAGIARPEAFAQTLRDLGLNIVGFQGLADHVSYGQEQLAALYDQAGRMGAAACITTEKDMVKLHRFARTLPVYALRLEARLQEDFLDFLAARLAS